MPRHSTRGEIIAFYPESDGKPMSETDEHRLIMTYLIEALAWWFRAKKDVYVSGNLMLYYVEGDANLKVSPDVFVVKGVPKRRRRVYKTWDEGKGIDVVVEVSSRGTKSEDFGWKFELYRDVLGVKEYYVYDPLREYLPTRLKAWRKRGRELVERTVKGGRIESPELGLVLVDADGMLRLEDPSTGRVLPSMAEAEDAREAEQASREAAQAARDAAEAKQRELEAENDRLRRQLRERKNGG